MARRRRTKWKTRASKVEASIRVPRNTSVADAIKTRVARYYKAKNRVCFFELGLCPGGRLRADVLVLAMNGHLVIVEVKSSVADFRTDKKMALYEPFCNQAYLALPESVYLKVKDRILDGWGVFVMGEDGTTIKRVKGARAYDMDPDESRDLLIRAAFRNADTNNAKSKVKIEIEDAPGYI